MHGCSFCGWTRISATPVMLTPSCARCGCALDARAAGGGGAALLRPAWAPAPRAMRVLRAVGLLLGALALYAAASLGFHSGGPAGAMVAFGVGGFLLLPFVPERVGTAPGR
jgi:hypothetical protein